MNYNNVVSAKLSEFNRIKKEYYPDHVLNDQEKFTLADAAELAKIENILDVEPGTLGKLEDYTERYECGCGRVLTTYDAVFTSLVDAAHSKSFVLHTFVGTKYVITKAHHIRCSSCGMLSSRPLGYAGHHYECDLDTDPK